MTSGTPITRNEMKSSSLGEYIRTQQKIIIPPMNLPRERSLFWPQSRTIKSFSPLPVPRHIRSSKLNSKAIELLRKSEK